MKKFIKESGGKVKEIIISPRGWMSWFIANIITSSPWLIPLIYYLITNDLKYLALSGTIWTLQMAPFPLETFLNIAITLFIYNLIKKKPIKIENPQ
jgi:hypothetical protein